VYYTANLYKLVKDSNRIDIRKYSFTSGTVNIWNSLHNNIMLLMLTLLTYLRRAWTNFRGVRTLCLIGKPT